MFILYFIDLLFYSNISRWALYLHTQLQPWYVFVVKHSNWNSCIILCEYYNYIVFSSIYSLMVFQDFQWHCATVQSIHRSQEWSNMQRQKIIDNLKYVRSVCSATVGKYRNMRRLAPAYAHTNATEKLTWSYVCRILKTNVFHFYYFI